jgi:hypothetical protein
LARESGFEKVGGFDAPGVNVLAAGFGLNSMAFTLNFDADDDGVRAFVGLETFDWSLVVPVRGS